MSSERAYDERRAARVQLAGEETLLLPERALFWPRERTLFIADPHFGKAAAFRAFGIPVPEAVSFDTLRRLADLVRALAVARVVVLGDFLHHRAGRSQATLASLSAWRRGHTGLEVALIPGNHDAHAGLPWESLDIRVLPDGSALGPFALHHAPEDCGGRFGLCGHLHPALRLRNGFESMRLRCFWVRRGIAVLPAFGAFTGSSDIEPEPGDAVYVIAERQVLRVPPRARFP